MAKNRPNFFALLGLDPRAPWDQALYERELAKRRNAWAMTAQNSIGKKKQDAQFHVSLVDEIKEVMSTDGLRRQERDLAVRHELAALEERRRELRERLSLMLAKGHLLLREETELRERFSDVLAADRDLADQIERAAKRGDDNGEASARLTLEQEKNLSGQLEVVGEISLYELLKGVDESLTNTSPVEQLREAAQTLWQRTHDIKNKTSDPTLGTREQLGAFAKSVFVSEESRRRHDASMKVLTLQAIIKRFEIALKFAESVSAEQFEIYLGQARRNGVDDVLLAKQLLVAHFGRLGWIVELPTAETEQQLRSRVQCPRCAELNDETAAACATCSLLLREPCPGCGTVDPAYGLGCRACGFPIGQRYLVEELVAQARSALGAHDLEQATLRIDRAARIWKLPEGRTDPLASEIREAKDAVQTALTSISEALARMDKLFDERNFLAAVQEIRAAPANLPHRDVLLDRATAEITKATGLYQRAQRPNVPNARRAELYAAALDICADLTAARNELDHIPPDPPGPPKATVADPAAGVRLSWPPSSHVDTTYVVVRVAGNQVPESPEEVPSSDRLGKTSETRFRDATAAALPGVPLRYAVFTERSGVYSTAAVTAPVVITSEAAVEIAADDGEVTLNWQTPDTAVQVEVTRAEIGNGRDKPLRLPITTPGGLTDTDVRNGIRYRYAVRVAYSGPSGTLVWSPGRSWEVTPVGRPAPPGPLAVVKVSTELSLAEHTTQLRWAPPGQGAGKVIRLHGIGTLRQGDRVTEAELYRAGRVFDGPSPVNDAWIDRSLTFCTYLPIVVLNGTAYAGAPRRYARTAEPTGLHVEYAGPNVLIGWTWPEGCTGALLGYDLSGRPLTDPTVAAHRLLVGRHPGDRTGGCEIPAEPSTNVSVVLASAVDHEGSRFIGSGVPAQAVRPAARVGYEVCRADARRRLDRLELVLTADTPVDLPALTLRAHADRRPHTPDDGEVITSLAPFRLAGELTVSLPKTARPDDRYRLFTAPAAAQSVSLDPR